MRYFVAFVLLLLLSGFCDWVALTAYARKGSQSKRDRQWRDRKSECQKTTCSHLIPDEAYNCVNLCTSAACYEEVYASSPLEDGEVDSERQHAFTRCLRSELKEEQRRRALLKDSTDP